ncbi:lytic polysaccharide monooxygenase [Enterococcus faecalis]|uniref:lytic polysaccharide monooxygenase n=1 Tax=Enterococcus faecalis TaxID=1351 RepID=UPI00273788D0|nr:lytic polysaccharide monooxygenase [Enterococcus faecalis]
MKKKLFKNLLVTFSLLGSSFLLSNNTSFAHGYVESPPARGYQGKLDLKSLGWAKATNLYGNVISNPQSLEAPKGFPQKGPRDGHIASADGGLGQIGDYVLDNQTSTRWKKTDIRPGQNTFTWHYTAPHRTSKWHYYMTKQGWNPNSPLNRDDLELIATIDHDGTTATNNLSHTINIPSDRLGYNIVLAVWDVADTSNAFYNVIDVNVQNYMLPTYPVKPNNVKFTKLTEKSVNLYWNYQTTAEKYNVYRDDTKIATINQTNYEDSSLDPSTEYKYEIEAVSLDGKVSEKSDALTVKTLEKNTEEPPTSPNDLHSISQTPNTISLMWRASQHNSGIKIYEIYRDGILVNTTKKTSYTDINLTPSRDYKYKVKAVALDGSVSESSNELTIGTKNNIVTSPEKYKDFKLGTPIQPEFYDKNDLVSYDGNYYIVITSHYNYGDSSWNPKDEHSLFRAF